MPLDLTFNMNVRFYIFMLLSFICHFVMIYLSVYLPFFVVISVCYITSIISLKCFEISFKISNYFILHSSNESSSLNSWNIHKDSFQSENILFIKLFILTENLAELCNLLHPQNEVRKAVFSKRQQLSKAFNILALKQETK